LPKDTSLVLRFDSVPGFSGTSYPPGWRGYNGSALPAQQLLLGNSSATNAGIYNFGASLGIIGENAYDPGYLVWKLAATRRRDNFRLAYLGTNVSDASLGQAEYVVQVSTGGPQSGFNDLPNSSYGTTQIPSEGSSTFVTNIVLPDSVEDRAGPVYLRWRYDPEEFNPLGSSRGDGLSIDSIRLRWDRLPFSVSLGGDRTACDGSPVTLDASQSGSGFSYTWSTGDTTPTISPTTAGSFSVRVTGPAGFVARDTVQISRTTYDFAGADRTNLTAGDSTTGTHTQGIEADPDSVCARALLQYAIQPPGSQTNSDYNNTWRLASVVTITPDQSNAPPYQGQAQVLPPAGGDGAELRLRPAPAMGGHRYRVQLALRNLQNQCVDTLTRFVAVQPVPAPGLPDQAFLCSAQDSLTLQAQDPAASYSWNTGASGPALTVDTAGLYSLTATNSLGCLLRDSVQVSRESYRPNLQSDTACGSITLDASYPQTFGQALYLWSNGQATPTLQVQQSGTYSVWVQTPSGCQRSDTVQVGVLPYPSSPLPDSVAQCGDAPAVLDAGPPQRDYLWNTGATTAKISVQQPGSYSVQISRKGCQRLFNTQVFAAAKPPVDLGPDRSVCGQAVLDAGPGGGQYRWSLGDTSRFFTTPLSGTYAVRVQAPNGCRNSDTVRLVVAPRFSVHLTVLPDTVRVGQPVPMHGQTDGRQLSWRWAFGDQNFANLPDSLRYAYAEPGTYPVVLTLSNEACSLSDTDSVVVLPRDTTSRAVAARKQDAVPLVAPNPVQGRRLRLSQLRPALGPLRLRLLAPDGRRVWQQGPLRPQAAEAQFTLPPLPAGLYFLQTQGPGRPRHTQRVVIR
jgi:hypothetical protein